MYKLLKSVKRDSAVKIKLTGFTVASHAVVFRGDRIALAPHKRLLNREQHSFPPLSQSNFTYQYLVGWPWPHDAVRGARSKQHVYAWFRQSYKLTSLGFITKFNFRYTISEFANGKRKAMFSLIAVNRLCMFVKRCLQCSSTVSPILWIALCVFSSCKFDEGTSQVFVKYWFICSKSERFEESRGGKSTGKSSTFGCVWQATAGNMPAFAGYSEQWNGNIFFGRERFECLSKRMWALR